MDKEDIEYRGPSTFWPEFWTSELKGCERAPLALAGAAMAPRFKVGEEVWVKDEHPEIHQVFSKGDIRIIDGDKVTVETSTGAKTQELVLPLAEIFKVNPEGDVPDHCQLLHLSPPTLLWNTIKRFEKDLIYTSVGDILVAVNPFQWITGLYGQERMNEVKGKKFLSAACGPHPYGIGEKVRASRVRVSSFFFSFGSPGS